MATGSPHELLGSSETRLLRRLILYQTRLSVLCRGTLDNLSHLNVSPDGSGAVGLHQLAFYIDLIDDLVHANDAFYSLFWLDLGSLRLAISPFRPRELKVVVVSVRVPPPVRRHKESGTFLELQIHHDHAASLHYD